MPSRNTCILEGNMVETGRGSIYPEERRVADITARLEAAEQQAMAQRFVTGGGVVAASLVDLKTMTIRIPEEQ